MSHIYHIGNNFNYLTNRKILQYYLHIIHSDVMVNQGIVK